MKRLQWVTAAIALLVFSSSFAKAEGTSSYARLLFHGTNALTEQWGMAGWVVLPNYTVDPTKTFVVVGPRYHQKDWWVELMGGQLIADQQSQLALDLRASFDRFDPIHFWGEVTSFPETEGWFTC